VLDEAKQPIKGAEAILGGQRYQADESGEIIIPFTNQPGNQSVILTDGNGFAQRESIPLAGEAYELDTNPFVNHESLLSGKIANVALRPFLTLNGSPMDLGLLEDVEVDITAHNIDGVSAVKSAKNLKLENGKDAVLKFSVPERMASVELTMRANIKSLITGQKIPLTHSETKTVSNGNMQTLTKDLYLTQIGANYFVQVFGRNGEPRADQAVNLQL
jgi:hypothetical protein